MNEFDKNNNDLWIWGVFYINPNDPGIWVDKRYGLGWTLNFAYSISYFYVALILAIPIIFMILL